MGHLNHMNIIRHAKPVHEVSIVPNTMLAAIMMAENRR